MKKKIFSDQVNLEESIKTIIEDTTFQNWYELQENFLVIKEVLDCFYKENIIFEGLIKTFGIKDVAKVLNKKDAKKYNISLSKEVKSIIPLEFINKIRMNFKNGVNGVTEEYYNDLIHTMEVLGWYAAQTNLSNQKELSFEYLQSENTPFDLIFEPKFDIEIDFNLLPNYLWHITPTIYLEKVLKKGLTPKDGSMVTNHPERTYLFLEYPKNWKEDILSNMSFNKNYDGMFTLLLIDKSKINSSTSFYVDPNSENYNACFTLEPISPKAIKRMDYGTKV